MVIGYELESSLTKITAEKRPYEALHELYASNLTGFII